MSNVVFMVNLPDSRKPGRNNPYSYSINSWKHYCKRYGCELFVLTERVNDESYMNANWHKLYALQLLEHNGVDYDKVLIVDCDTIVHPESPNIFHYGYEFYAAHNDGSYDWLLRSYEIYSEKVFDGLTFPFTDYFNSGVLLVNEFHKEFFDRALEYYDDNRSLLQNIQEKYHVGTDQPVLNFLIHKYGVDFKLLPYEWNMQDMCRKEILDLELTFTKFGWIYHFNAIPSNYKLTNDDTSPVYQWMKYTYEKLYG